MAIVQHFDQRLFVHQTAAGGIDQVGAFAHLAHLGFADDVGGFLSTWNVQRNDVGPGQQFIQRLHRHAHAAGGGCRQERVIGGDLHANASSLAGHGRPDTAQTDDAQTFALEFESGQAVFRPFAGFHPGVGSRHMARHRKQ
jgi:hypothetical protein